MILMFQRINDCLLYGDIFYNVVDLQKTLSFSYNAGVQIDYDRFYNFSYFLKGYEPLRTFSLADNHTIFLRVTSSLIFSFHLQAKTCIVLETFIVEPFSVFWISKGGPGYEYIQVLV